MAKDSAIEKPVEREKNSGRRSSRQPTLSLDSIGKSVPTALANEIRGKINQFLVWHPTDEAPMSLPTPLSRSKLNQMAESPHFVCEKSTGIRLLCLLRSDACYLISQGYQIRQAPLYCPIRADRIAGGNTSQVHHWTILDGEMVLDDRNHLLFLIYDALAYNGHTMINHSIPDRLKMIQNDIISPRKKLTSFPYQEQFQLALQSIFPVEQIATVIKDIIPRMVRPNVGLLFIPVTKPYVYGVNRDLLYWRTASRNTVDFQVAVEWRGRPQTPGYKLMLRDKRTLVFHDYVRLEAEDAAVFNQKGSLKIGKFYFDPEYLTFIPSDKSSWDIGNPSFVHPTKGEGWRVGGWKLVGWRSDVSSPVEKSELQYVEKSIADNIPIEELMSFFSPDEKVSAEAKSLARKAAEMEANKRIEDREKNLVVKRQKTATSVPGGMGVCYDFQNHGDCRRGEKCHFSHCACDTSCTCTKDHNTFGQRPAGKAEEDDEDEEKKEEVENVAAGFRSANVSATTITKDVLGGEQGEVVTTTGAAAAANKLSQDSFTNLSLTERQELLGANFIQQLWADLDLENIPETKKAAGYHINPSGKVTII